MIPREQVDLAAPPAKRWAFVRTYAKQAAELADSYARDLGGVDAFGSLLSGYVEMQVPADVQAEMVAIAEMIDRPLATVQLANVYYDAMRAVLGCTAFAIDHPEGPIHARNLDWWTDNSALEKHTIIAELSGAKAGPFELVTWPGFVGAFSGVAKGRFAITLNAVISNETPQLAESVSLFLRRVFETAPDYEAALEMLVFTPIAADCLLLVTGAKQGELCVVERTSTKAEVRHANVRGRVVVTNDYRLIDDGFDENKKTMSALHSTACSRFDRAHELAEQLEHLDSGSLLNLLSDSKIKMGITVQQMVMRASTGALWVQLPS